MVDQWAFIESVARNLGVTHGTLMKWRIRGVPGKYRLPIVDEALAQGFAFDREAFDRRPPRRRHHTQEKANGT